MSEIGNPYRGKIYVWLMVSKSSVDGHLAPFLWSCDEAAHHGGAQNRGARSPPVSEEAEGLEEEGFRIPSQDTPRDLTSSQ